MATRFYLSSTAAADVTPSGISSSSWWQVSTGYDVRKMNTIKDSSTITSKTSGVTATNGNSVLNRQYVSSPLAAQSIAVNTTALVALRGNISATAASNMIFRVTILTGTSTFTIFINSTLNGNLGNTSYTTTLTNRTNSYNSVAVTVNAGDRLLFEIGFLNNSSTSISATQSFGSSAGIDLPSDNTTTTANDSWIEISQTLLFQSASIPVKNFGLLGIG